MRYVFLLSTFSFLLSFSSLSAPACSRVTAQLTSRTRPLSVMLAASELLGSAVRTELSVKGLDARSLTCRQGCQHGILNQRRRDATSKTERFVKLTGIELTPVPPTSAASKLASSIAFSASSFFQKQTNPVPRDRLVALSMVIRAYRRGP